MSINGIIVLGTVKTGTGFVTETMTDIQIDTKSVQRQKGCQPSPLDVKIL